MQTQIPFEEVIQALDSLKWSRRDGLMRTWIFADKEVDFLIRITYDITDKDFEYLVAHILEHDGYTTNVQWGFGDKWVDIVAKKDGRIYFIQCKQWSKSCVTMKNVWDYYGTIYQEKMKNPDKVFAYVTTSYVVPEAEKFLIDHGIAWIISNKKLIAECRKLGYFSDLGWRNLIQDIQHKRLLDLRKWRQLSLESGFEKVKKDLRTARLSELKHHLPKSIRYKSSSINPIRHKEFLNHFFQYWNLV